MIELLEFNVRVGEEPEMPMVSYACHNAVDEDNFPRYKNLLEVLQDGWEVVNVMPAIQHGRGPGALYSQTFWLQRKHGIFTASGWYQTMDPEEDNYAIPEDERNVLVFLNGHVELTDNEGRKGGPWGIMIGWFDQDKRFWHAGASRDTSRWVTHWHELPPNPIRNPLLG